MTTVILLAGIASRLRPLTDALPKCLLPINGRTLLQRTLDALVPLRPEKVVLVTGFQAAMISRFVESISLPLAITFVENPWYATTGNNYSLRLSAPSAAGEELLLLDGDILFDPVLLAELAASPHENCLLYRRDPAMGEEEVKVALDPAGRVRRIGKDIDSRVAAGESVGIEKFSRAASRELFTILEMRKERVEFYEASFQRLIDDGTCIQALDCGSRACIEIDTPADLQEAEHIASQHHL